MSTIREVTETKFECELCGARYDTEEEAQERCGSLQTEEPRFSPGDEVLVRERQLCIGGCNGGSAAAKGKVIEVCGPIVGNLVKEDGARNYGAFGHVYIYEVAFDCVGCGKKKEKSFFTSDLMEA